MQAYVGLNGPLTSCRADARSPGGKSRPTVKWLLQGSPSRRTPRVIETRGFGMPSDSLPGRLRTETEAGICWIIADNPARLNAYTRAMWEALPNLMREAEADPAVRVIVLAGAGEKAFSAGADISEFKSNR